ncbi:TIGR04376 family protein [Pseudanabaena sp. PCC 6802]|uniref:TIGR04376 family protein n=1 Tax=Pseudanabaena sp. PCC 6802 TaxID=118173 RepID=UPI00034BE42F|nr:TIGR04376 family protein [Pseudanabaena sp. PCC 6802]
MGLLDDISRFLETRLEEYIRNNPQIELQILEEKLTQQESEVAKLIASFRTQEKQLQDRILAIADDIRIWHERAKKASDANRQDLASAAKEREAALLKQGNQVWAQMELIKQRISQTADLQSQIQSRMQEVRTKIAEAAKTKSQSQASERASTSFNWENLHTPSQGTDDPLEQQFRRWEMDEELERLKRKMGK